MTLRVDRIEKRDGSAGADVIHMINGSAKVWMNYDGYTTNTVRDSHNVSSVTDNGVGDYTCTFANAFIGNVYSCSSNGTSNSGGRAFSTALRVNSSGSDYETNIQSTSVRVATGGSGQPHYVDSYYDCPAFNLQIQGGLA